MLANNNIVCKNGTCYIAPSVFVKSNSDFSAVSSSIIGFKLNADQTAVEVGTNVLTYKRASPGTLNMTLVNFSRSFFRNNEFMVALDYSSSTYSYKKNGATVSLAAPSNYKWVGLYLIADS